LQPTLQMTNAGLPYSFMNRRIPGKNSNHSDYFTGIL